ncbi:restriction endonuclease subunit S [Bifidobacterium bifidum]|uniref:restriction endonuclease subunit S n=1 Tax=Bifidobacterium bifidum TaxID=1681 RepID=UPI001C6FE073
MSAINYLPPFASSLIMHVLTNAEKLIPLRDAASLAESRRLAGMRMVTGTTSPSTRYERISVSPASCSIKSEYVIASHAFKPQYKCINYTPAWEQRKFSDIVDVYSGKDYKHLEGGPIPVYGTGGFMTSVDEALSYDRDAVGIGRKGTIDKPYLLKAPFWTVDTLFYAIPKPDMDLEFVHCSFLNVDWKSKDESTGLPSLSKEAINETIALVPSFNEQSRLGEFFSDLDSLITLHQRKRESRIIRVRSFIWLAGDISGIGVSAYQPEKRRPYDRRQHQRRNVVLRLLRAMDQRIQGRCNS